MHLRREGRAQGATWRWPRCANPSGHRRSSVGILPRSGL